MYFTGKWKTFREAQNDMGGVECGTLEDKAKYLGTPHHPPIFVFDTFLLFRPHDRSRQADSLR